MGGRALFPATAFLEVGAAAARSLAEDAQHTRLTLQTVAILAAKLLDQPLPDQLLCHVAPDTLSISSTSASGSATQHITARAQQCTALKPARPPGQGLLRKLGGRAGTGSLCRALVTVGGLAAITDPHAVGAAAYAAHPAQADCVLHIGAVPQTLQVLYFFCPMSLHSLHGHTAASAGPWLQAAYL